MRRLDRSLALAESVQVHDSLARAAEALGDESLPVVDALSRGEALS